MNVVVNFTADEKLISPVDKTVRNTVLNTEGTKATLSGQYDRAQTLFTTSGNTGMAKKVETLAKSGEDAKRTLRTVTVTEANNGIIGKKGAK